MPELETGDITKYVTNISFLNGLGMVNDIVPTNETFSPLPFLGLALRHYRLQNALTQTEFGRRVGLSQAYVYFLESGRRRPSLEMLDRLCEQLGVSMSEIFAKAEDLAREAGDPKNAR